MRHNLLRILQLYCWIQKTLMKIKPTHCKRNTQKNKQKYGKHTKTCSKHTNQKH